MSLPIMGAPDKNSPILVVYTIEQCTKCKKQTKREFTEGDLVHKLTNDCKDCNEKLMISLIYGEPKKKN
jgi:hypothetical protein|tara:strand:- start:4008 stop:4214 length:207 start_codon:yes stop_codon:yes gene_type:complete